MNRQRLALQHGSFSLSIDPSVAKELDLSDGAEVEMHVENGRLVVEPLRPKILAPVSDVAARAERTKRVAAAMDEVMTDHRELFALLAR